MFEASRAIRKQAGTAAGPALVETRDLTLVRDGKRLVDGLYLKIQPCRRTLVLGANGAGKSLLLRLLHGMIEPTGGGIVWQGRSLDREARRAQAMVFQRPVMLRRSVIANLRFALSARGVGGAQREEKARAALEAARLSEFADRPARVLSGGEQQRLAIARALACDPKLLFLDEPTASLDPASTQAVEDLINAAHASGITIVMTTHDIGQARRLADDVIFLHRGTLAEAGPAGAFFESPRSEPARAWIAGRLHLD